MFATSRRPRASGSRPQSATGSMKAGRQIARRPSIAGRTRGDELKSVGVAQTAWRCQAVPAGRRIFEAWSDEPWVIDGAAVRVSLVCFSRDDESVFGAQLDGQPVDEVYADLTARCCSSGDTHPTANMSLSDVNRERSRLGVPVGKNDCAARSGQSPGS